MKVLEVRKIASSQCVNNSLIIVIEIVIEDDAQDGGDDVDAHRSICVSRRTVREAKGYALHFVQHREHGPNERGLGLSAVTAFPFREGRFRHARFMDCSFPRSEHSGD